MLSSIADDDFKLNALWEILQTRLVRRSVPVKNLTRGDRRAGGQRTVRQEITLQQGIPTEAAKDIVKFLKDAKLKRVQASIQGDQVRVTSPRKTTCRKRCGAARAGFRRRAPVRQLSRLRGGGAQKGRWSHAARDGRSRCSGWLAGGRMQPPGAFQSH